MTIIFTLGCSGVFVDEKRSEAYTEYGEASIAVENAAMRQELSKAAQLSWVESESSGRLS